MATQKALWLPKIGTEFILGKNKIPEPGRGEVLVKLAASALNPLDLVIPKSGFFDITEYPAILGEEGAGVVHKVGDGVTNLAKGDKVFVPSAFCIRRRMACPYLAQACGQVVPDDFGK